MIDGKAPSGGIAREVGGDLAAGVHGAIDPWHWYPPAGTKAPVGLAGRDELLAFLNQLLEAERAGARIALEMARGGINPAFVQLMWNIKEDEMRWCAMLQRWIGDLDGDASPCMGIFCEKAMMVDDPAARIAFFNRGQGRVVRKLRSLIPRVRKPALYADLSHMLATHVANITLTNSIVL